MDDSVLSRLQPVSGRVDAVLDTDTYNEIDDQFALSLMLACPERINLVGIYAAPFLNPRSASPEDGMLKSYAEILKLLDISGHGDMKTLAYQGSRSYLPDERTPVDSPAARQLVRAALAHTPENPLYVVAIGAITNVASALLMRPEIAGSTVIVWLGGHALHWPDTREFNMAQDVAAARVVLKSGAAVVMLPCFGCVSEFRISEPELKFWFKGKNSLADYLADGAIEEANSYAPGRPWSRVIWDVCAAAYLINDDDRFMNSRIIKMPLPGYDFKYSETEFAPVPVRYVWYIHRDRLMEELIKRITRA
ncbi:MAG: nucleoside hydrolase [Clostridia bacterium]|nr:nucleoside hydrolase [Clostridia bacterium]